MSTYHVALGPDRVGHRPGILGELSGAEGPDVLNPVDRLGVHVAGELLVSEHGQPLLERELEPVSARDSIARPVVKVLHRNKEAE